MNNEQYINANEAFIFGLDEVLYPEKDYLLQVFYLFAQFIEYGEQIEGQGIVDFMKETYEKEGASDIFAKTAAKFSLPEKYQLNYDLLLQNARLPLKLLLFAPVLSFLQAIKAAGKQIFLLVEGDPAQQLNKIRQMEWNGLERDLTVYFSAESASGSLEETLSNLLLKHELNNEKTVLLGVGEKTGNIADYVKINYLEIDKLYLP